MVAFWPAVLLCCVAQGEPAPLDLTASVNDAIARGVEHLKRAQRPDGHWNGHDQTHPGGETALAAFTLLKSGVRSGDAALERARKALAATEFKSVYSHSVRLLFLDALAEPERTRALAEASLAFLVASQVEGLWAYPWGEIDLSNTQFALLGLRAAARIGLEIPRPTLANCAQALPRWSAKGGGFPYLQRTQPTGGMTAATLAGFEVLRELTGNDAPLKRALDKATQARTEAERWLTLRFDAEHNAYGPRAWTPAFHYPYLWAIERYGGLTQRARIAERDWYAEGARWLVAAQNDDGGWGVTLDDACFALLFLRRATFTLGPNDVAGAVAAREPKPKGVEPASELAYCTEVLLAGPWTGDEPGLALLQPPFEPRRARAKLGEKLARREWRRVALKPADWTNLEELVENERGEHELYALAATLAWDRAEPLEASLWFHIEDGWDVYFDGERVTFGQRVQAPIDGRVRADVRLTSGEHTLLALVEEETGAVPFALRISDREGRPLAHSPRVWAVAPKASQR